MQLNTKEEYFLLHKNAKKINKKTKISNHINICTTETTKS
mgnify:CR=1 FL=1